MPRKRNKRKRPCEACGTRAVLIPYRIYLDEPLEGRNRIDLDERCRALAQTDKIHASTLRAIAKDREDAKTRELMGHAAYAREGNGAVRQIRNH